MTIDTPPIPPAGEPKKKNNNLLWGCLIALVLGIVVVCCGVTLIFMPLFSEYDPLGTGLRDQLDAYLDDPSTIPGFEDLMDEGSGLNGEDYDPGPTFEDLYDAQDLPLAWFNFLDIGTSFYYPAGWDIEMEGYGVTFYDPESYTYIYMGEDKTDPGTTAEDIALDILDSIQEEAQEDTYKLISSDTYFVPIAEDAHLTLFEWVDEDGYYTWAYDLEIVIGDSNIFMFLSGEDPDEILFYGELLDIIASSFELVPKPEPIDDA